MPEFTNLLPENRIQALRRDYRMRLCVVACWFVTALALMAGILLAPSYWLLFKAESKKQEHLNQLTASLSTIDEAELAKRLAALSQNAAALTSLEKKKSVSTVVEEALAVRHPGISLHGFIYKDEEATLAITGTADTRTALRNYQSALQNAPFATSATLPVSAYAKESMIPFTITIQLQP